MRVRLQPGAGPIVAGLLLLGVPCYAVAHLAGMALGETLRGVLSPGPIAGLVVLFVFLLWGLLWYAGARVFALTLLRREARQKVVEQRRFESRVALSDEEFGRLFQGMPMSVAASIRAELGRFIGRAEVVSRLLPTDSVLDICVLAGVQRDSLDWVEFVMGLEQRFEARIWERIPFPETIADLVRTCARATASEAERSAVADPPPE